MNNFVNNVKRCMMIAQYSTIEKAREQFSELTNDEFFLIWHAAMLNLCFHYERKGKVGENLT